mmetsp:Transcript_5561/g.8973  ORF Transcript_5561/g.8973 Transcript_5561/m.8973 type:complete len:289 (+) Transcript_5561:134-1000(+)
MNMMLQAVPRPPPPPLGGYGYQGPSPLSFARAKAAPSLYAVGDGGGAQAHDVALQAAAAPDLMTGTVKCWFEDRGFGFITPDGGSEDVFVHKRVLKDGQSLIPNSPVLFDLTYDADKRKFQATQCFGATDAPQPGPGEDLSGHGARRLDSGPFCLDDPWQDLYESAQASHLRAHLDGLPGTEPPGAGTPGTLGRPLTAERLLGEQSSGSGADGPGSGDGVLGSATREAEVVSAEPSSSQTSLAATSVAEGGASHEVNTTSAEAEASKEDAKATSIYDFFQDEEDISMM